MPKLAKSLKIYHDEHRVVIDDEEFPYFLHADGPKTEATLEDGVTIVFLPVIVVGSVEEIGEAHS